MKKKFLSVLMASILCLSIAGCGQAKNPPSVDEEPAQSTTPPAQSTDSTVQPTATDESGTPTTASEKPAETEPQPAQSTDFTVQPTVTDESGTPTTASEKPAETEPQPAKSTDSAVQPPITDEVGTLTAVTTAGGYEIKLSDLAHQTGSDNDPVVYYTSVIDSDALMAIYKALGRTPAEGDRVAVKLHTGEGDGSYNLDPQFIKALVQSVDGTIVECNTAYGGNRASTALHMQVAEDHGYTAIADVDIMDADGGMEIPVTGGTHLKTDLVGSHLANYDFCMVLSHFKGHSMGGFGGALKNISIGIASSTGKSLIHSGGTETTGFGWGTSAETFTESMAEAASAVYDYFDGGEKMVFISVMNNISVDCDCMANPAEPDMHDVGILASTDPVALDQACVDFLRAVPDGASVIRRMESRSGEHILDHADELGFCSRTYKLVSIDE